MLPPDIQGIFPDYLFLHFKVRFCRLIQIHFRHHWNSRLGQFSFCTGGWMMRQAVGNIYCRD